MILEDNILLLQKFARVAEYNMVVKAMASVWIRIRTSSTLPSATYDRRKPASASFQRQPIRPSLASQTHRRVPRDSSPSQIRYLPRGYQATKVSRDSNRHAILDRSWLVSSPFAAQPSSNECLNLRCLLCARRLRLRLPPRELHASRRPWCSSMAQRPLPHLTGDHLLLPT
jgi:hypothetical protein